MKIKVECIVLHWTIHPLTSGIHDSKHAYVPKADIFNTCRKLIYVEKQRNNISREHLPQVNIFRHSELN